MTSYQRDANFVLRLVGDHQVLVPIAGSLGADTFLLLLDGPVAHAVWEALAEPRTRDQLVELVTTTFEVERDVALGDVETFLAQLESGGCVTLS